MIIKGQYYQLLLRFYDTISGSINIGSHEIKNIQIKNLRENIGYVSQDIFMFDGTGENPTTDHVNAGVAFAKTQGNIDLIVALGGGSAMDCAKGINFILTNGGQIEDYHGMGHAQKPMLPSIGIPTTAGTGSEAQSYALIANADTHMKMACGDLFRVKYLNTRAVKQSGFMSFKSNYGVQIKLYF